MTFSLHVNICVLTFVLRNETYCVNGSINLHVYESRSVDMKKVSYPQSAMVGEKETLKCPSIRDFNKTDRHTQTERIEWYKVRGQTLGIGH